MPYLLNNLVDGETPSASYVGVDHKPTTGEFIVTDATWESRRDWIWDASIPGIRPPTDADRLRSAKKLKKTEGTRRMHSEVEGLFPEVRDVSGAWVAEALIEMVSDPRGARVAGIKERRDKRARFHAAVDAKTSVDNVHATSWENA